METPPGLLLFITLYRTLPNLHVPGIIVSRVSSKSNPKMSMSSTVFSAWKELGQRRLWHRGTTSKSLLKLVTTGLSTLSEQVHTAPHRELSNPSEAPPSHVQLNVEMEGGRVAQAFGCFSALTIMLGAPSFATESRAGVARDSFSAKGGR